MRCRKHPADASSGVGVCASCLRERMLSVIALQSRRDCSRPDAGPPLPFPRSVSRRKSDTRPRCHGHQRFFSTPQVGPSAGKGKGGGGFVSLLFGVFRSKQKVGAGAGSDSICEPGAPTHSSCSVSSSPLFFPQKSFPGRRKKNVGTFSADECRNGSGPMRISGHRNRGMSPSKKSGDGDDGGSSGHSSGSSQCWMQTPRRTPARSGGGRAAAHDKGISSFTFCLSPLVQAGPSRRWSHKGFSAAASFCKNRSRKLADFGRHNYDPNH